MFVLMAPFALAPNLDEIDDLLISELVGKQNTEAYFVVSCVDSKSFH